MRVWLLQNKAGGLTCGHLHDRDAEAWRCLDAQADPGGWSVVDTYLSEPEGTRPHRDAVGICLLSVVVLLFSFLFVGFAAAAVYVIWAGLELWAGLALAACAVAAGVVLVPICGWLYREIRHPSNVAWGGWDWW